jgi:uncharacterized protein YjbI with pentapeptide repeats
MDEGANLKGETIWGPNCHEYWTYKGARMDGVKLHGKFKNTIFSGVTFVDATFESCVFENCAFDGAIIKNSKFKVLSQHNRNNVFSRCNFQNVQFLTTELPEFVHFRDSDLSAAKFKNLETKADFVRCDLREVVFEAVSGSFIASKSNLEGINFGEGNLTQSEFRQPNQVARALSEIEIRLEEIGSLREQGLINDDEYNATRKKILGL